MVLNAAPEDLVALLAFYDATAASYVARTRHLDMDSPRTDFLNEVVRGGAICDAGCGSGRDTLAFRASGHPVVAFDGSPAMAALAARETGQPVACMRFDQVEDVSAFDGAWACASLLHLTDEQLVDALARLLRSLRPGGVLFACFKFGGGMRRDPHGRWFNDMTPDRAYVLAGQAKGVITRTWCTAHATDPSVTWLNLFLRPR